MEKDTRNTLRNTVTSARKKLETAIAEVLEGRFGIYASGEVDDSRKMDHLEPKEREDRQIILAHLDHIRSGGFDAEGAVDQLTREIAFTHLNRLVAFKLMEQRGLIREAVSRGVQSRGVEFYLVDHPEDASLFDTGNQETAYRHFLSWQAQQFEDEISVLFSSSDPAEVVFPPQRVLDEVLGLINSRELAGIWTEDETIGWVYQYFTPKELREQARSESQAPRNSYELAFRNQFFTPRYVVEFLTDNTLGRTWYEMLQGETRLVDQCDYLVRRPKEVFLAQGKEIPERDDTSDLSQEELLQQPEHIPFREYKDPRRLKVLDPACGSGHFLLYAFDLLAEIYEEAWEKELVDSQTGDCLHTEYKSLEELRKQIPQLILRHNLHGIDIDRRAAQIAALALWLRAQRYFHEEGIQREKRVPIRQGNLVVAEPMPGDKELLEEFTDTLQPPLLGQLVKRVFEKMELAGEAGSLLKIEEAIEEDIAEAKKQWEARPEAEQLDLFPEYGKEPEPEQLDLFDVSQISDVRFWQQVEERLLEALKEYSKKVANGLGVQRQLFAEDAMGGFGFIDLMRKRYDVVLMNPPFGDSIEKVREYLEKYYPTWNKNILCSFIDRGFNFCLIDQGLLGAIFDRTAAIKKTYKKFRKSVLLNNDRAITCADLGWEILDANVEVTCITWKHIQESMNIDCGFIDVRDIDPQLKEHILQKKIYEFKINYVKTSDLIKLPNSVMGYDMPDFLIHLSSKNSQFENSGYKGLTGAQIRSEQHFRVFWECNISKGFFPKGDFCYLYNGGKYLRFFMPPRDVALFGQDGENVNEDDKSYSWRVQNKHSYFKSGVGFGVRGKYIDAHYLRKGYLFTVEGQNIPIKEENEKWYLLALLNSAAYQVAINSYCGQHKYSGYVNLLPLPEEPNKNVKKEIISYSKESFHLLEKWFEHSQTTLLFSGKPWLLITGVPQSIDDGYEIYSREYENLSYKLTKNYSQINNLVNKILNIRSEATLDRIEEVNNILEGNKINFFSKYELVCDLLDYFLALSFGMWGFDSLRNLPKGSDSISPPPTSYPKKPIAFNNEDKNRYFDYVSEGILVDDTDHNKDIVKIFHKVLEEIWGDISHSIEHEILAILEEKSLRYFLRKSGNTGYFTQHVKKYSESRRKAPIYWYLQSKDKNYGLWLYYHRLDEDMLYKALNNYVRPKVQQVQQRMEDLSIKADEDKKFQEEFEEQEDFYLELLDFQEKLQRAADLNLKPDLNDGVVLNIAPLHELVPWKEAEKYWKRLLNGKYEWSSIGKQLRERGLVDAQS